MLTFMACEGKAMGAGLEKASRALPESTRSGARPCGRASSPARSPNDCLCPSLHTHDTPLVLACPRSLSFLRTQRESLAGVHCTG